MNKLADAYDLIAEGFATAALEIRAQTVAVPDTAPSFDELPPAADTTWTETDDYPPKPAGSAAVCPAHGTEYREGKYGPYCPNTGTDPKWTNERGYCTLTPKNAAAYLRQKAQR